jgi:hypothetical protein
VDLLLFLDFFFFDFVLGGVVVMISSGKTVVIGSACNGTSLAVGWGTSLLVGALVDEDMI